MTDSTDVFSTATENVTVPPGSATEPTDGVLVTPTDGGTSVKPTDALSLACAMLASPSSARAVTVLV